MAYYYSRKLNMPFNDALERTIKNLQLQGFGIVTTIDIKNVLKEKLNVSFRNYRILGACNPGFAYKAISLDSHMGVMLPCNLVIQEHENGEIEVSAVSPLDIMEKALITPQIKEIAEEAGNRLRTAIDNLHRETPEPTHSEALPVETKTENVPFTIQG